MHSYALSNGTTSGPNRRGTRRIQKMLLGFLFILIHPLASAAGLMTPSNQQLPALDIKTHQVNVTVEDGYVITSVEQVFHNPHAQTLEAIYSFPVPEKAAVGEFTYWIDGKPVTGEVLEKQEARQVYEQEKAQGRETALTEKDEYKTFESSVYPVLPGQDVRIRLVYLQPAHVDHGIGRYVYPLEEGGVDEEKLAFWHYNDVVSEAFRFDMTIRSSYPIDQVRLPKHPNAQATKQTPNEWQIVLANPSTTAAATVNGDDEGNLSSPPVTAMTTASAPVQTVQRLDQDIVVYWRHAPGLPGSIDLVAHKTDPRGRGTFMMTVTPGDDLAAIDKGRDWIFVLDISGSMQGKFQSLVEGVRKGLGKLRPDDRFRVVLFNHQARELTPGYQMATTTDIDQVIQQLEQIRPNQGTNLYAGLMKGIDGLDADRSSAIILVTDGVANVGTTEKSAFLKLLEQHDVRLFTFVMGNSANRPLLDGMTRVSNGFAMSVSNSDDIVGQLLLATQKLNHQALHDIDLKISGVKVADLTPEHIGTLYRGQQLIVFGHYWGDGPAKVTMTGKISGEQKTYHTTFNFPATSDLNPEIERLWAFATIEDLQNRMDYLGEDADSKQAITSIAKEYGLVTDYTSMVIVRDDVFRQYGIDRTNQQRVAQEQSGRQQRAAAPVRDHRQDSRQPAFSQPRAYPQPGRGGHGGGAMDPWMLVLLLPLLGTLITRRTPGRHA